MAKIGFIGVGNMGGPMVSNLVKAGHAVTAFDLSTEALKAVSEAGASVGEDVADTAGARDVVITMLPAGDHVKAVYRGEDGVLAAAAPGTLLIDCSTIDVGTAREVCADAKTKGFEQLDAPVSGGVAGAAAGTLTFMAGGTDEAFARAEPILQNMGKTIVHAGPSGNGQVAKMCNNMMLAVNMIGTCEAFSLAERLGLDKQKLFDISSTASGQSWAMTSYCPVPGPVPNSPANRDFEAGFTAAMMLKDLRLALAGATASGASVPLGAEAAQLYAMFCNAGNEALDYSGIIKLVGDA
jgi:3-hydroxyisobutyrate dehydrogenase